MDRPKVLYIVHRFPYPPDKGDRIRTFNIIRYLSERCELTVAALDDEGVSEDLIQTFRARVPQLAALEVVPLKGIGKYFSMGKQFLLGKSISASFFHSRQMQKQLAEWAQTKHIDAVMISASTLAGYLNIFHSEKTKTIADLMDVDSEKWRQYANSCRHTGRLIYQHEYRCVNQLEQNLLRESDALILVSEQETRLFKTISRQQTASKHELEKIHAVINGVDLDYFTPVKVEQSQSLCFLGAMDYRPNIDATVWFVKNVWNHLRDNYENLVFNIVGRNPASEVMALRKYPGVHVTGAVPDVRPWLAEATAVIAPLRIARGIQNKVLEAMAMGRAVVTSPQALSGLNAQPDEHLLEALTPDDWYYQIRRLLQDETLRRTIEQAARQYVVENHSWSATLNKLDELIGLDQQQEVPTLR